MKIQCNNKLYRKTLNYLYLFSKLINKILNFKKIIKIFIRGLFEFSKKILNENYKK